MFRWRYILRSLWHHRRIHLAVALGVTVAAAVLTGALLVGDSVRGSLRRLALDRLGTIHDVILSENFFRAALADELAADAKFQAHYRRAVPAILLEGSVRSTGGPAPRRAGGVTLLGCDERFWALGGEDGPHPTPPADDEVILNAPLAAELGVAAGDFVSVWLPAAGGIPADSPLGRRDNLARSAGTLRVAAVVPAEGLGRFGISPSQHLPWIAFVPLSTLQRTLGETDRVNAVFAGGERAETPPPPDLLPQLLQPTLGDFGFAIKPVRRIYYPDDGDEPQTAFAYYSVSHVRMMIPPPSDAAVRRALADWDAQPALTFLANRLERGPVPADAVTAGLLVQQTLGGPLLAAALDGLREQVDRQSLAYLTITAIDSAAPLGPLVGDDGRPLPPLAEDEIALHAWSAAQLGAAVGDTILVTYFEPESTHGLVTERTVARRLAAIAPLTEPKQPFQGNEPARYVARPAPTNDPDLTPEVPGLTDQAAIDDWDPPFPFVRSRIRAAEERYWDDHRTTPAAYVPLADGRRMWASRFGETTSYRVPAAEGVTEEAIAGRLLAELRQDTAAHGFVFLPVKRNALEAAAGTTPFDALFLGFSMFLIAAALMLIALLFRLGVERRAGEIGLLLAVGFRRRAAARLLAREAALVATLGSLAGVAAGMGYAWLMLAGLRTWWLPAVGTPFLELHWTPRSLLIGYLAGGVAAIVTFVRSIANLRRISVRQLLTGQATPPLGLARRRRRLSAMLAWVLLVAASVLAVSAIRGTGEAQAGGFFGAGAAVLAAALLLVWRQFHWSATGGPGGRNPAELPLSFFRLAWRNAARNPGRSTLTIGLVAAAGFLLVAVSAFRLAPSAAGTGGFQLMAESAVPLFRNPTSPEGLAHYAFRNDERQRLAEVTTVPLRLKGGDDASCLNLYQAKQPRVLGVTPQWVRHVERTPAESRWRFSASAAPRDAERENPWRLLGIDPRGATPGDAAVPVILDQDTARYALHLYGTIGEVFEVEYDGGGTAARKVRFRIVGLLRGSVLQGNLLVGEADFLRLFPEVSGYRVFFIEAPPAQAAEVAAVLENRLGDFGFDAVATQTRLEQLQVVQNTYLSTFQSLGALGLLLGTLGLAAVQLRNAAERRGELALLRAAGFRRSRLAAMVLLESAMLLAGGLAIGILAAVIAVLPHALLGGAKIPWEMLAVLLATVLAAGLAASLIAVRAVLRAPLLPALRGD